MATCHCWCMGTSLMDDLTAVQIAEGQIEVDTQDEIIEAWQHLIDTGLCWQLQGWFGRTAFELLAKGICHD